MADEPSAEESRTTRTTLIMGGLVVFVCALLVVAVIAAVRTDRGAPAPTPNEAARRYFDAYVKGDCDDLIDLGTKRTWSNNGAMGELRARDRCRDIYTNQRHVIRTRYDKFKVLSEDKDHAAVEMLVISPDGNAAPERVNMRKENGAWKVDRPANQQRTPS